MVVPNLRVFKFGPIHSVSKLKGLVLGIFIGAIGIGVSELVAGLSRELRSPVLDVGDRFVDNVPAFLKNWAIAVFDVYDKQALLVGIGLTLVAYAAVVGLVGIKKNLTLGLVGISLFSVAGIAAVLLGSGSVSWWMTLPSIAGGLAAATALILVRQFIESSQTHIDTSSEMPVPNDRRRFIYSVGVLGAIGATAGVTGRWLNSRFSAAASRAEVILPKAKNPLPTAPAGVQAFDETPFFTPNKDFYRIDTALSIPQIPVDTWKLRIHGMVENELELTYEEILDMDLVEADITLTCVSNTVGGDKVGNARWLGVRLDELLDRVGVDPAADQIVGRSNINNGYTCGFPTEVLDGRDALLAVGMNGETLPLKHGFPARLVVPGLYGYISATKWLEEIELTTFDAFDSYWVPRGYADRAPIKMQARIDTLQGLQTIEAGDVTIGGVAWAQTRGISAVQVQIDDGDWQEAEMADELNLSTWRQWTFPWKAETGRHTVTVRAQDGSGAIQTADRAEPLPDGASGHHRIVVLVDA